MPGEKTKLTPLAARKQLLLLESDLNRAQLFEAINEWKVELHRSKEQLARLGTMATTAAKVAATVSAARRLFFRPAGEGKRSWTSFLFEGLTTGTTFWNLLRSYHRKKDE